MLHYSTVDPSTLELLKQLQEIPSLRNTRLVGGTALALQIGHRTSIDIDLFGEVDVESDRLIEELKTIGDLKIVKDSKNIRIYLINNVKVDIVNYNYSWLKDVININHIRLASPEDICAMKLAAVTGRGTKKDFIDIYYLLQSFSLEQMLSFYAQKYPEGYEFTVLKSLSYFEDAEREPMPYMLQKIDWETIKKSIESTIQFSFS